MTDSGEIDVDALESELSTIKDAMGLHERYPGLRSAWLVWGLAVALASLASQYVHTNRLPTLYFGLAWGGFVAAGWIAQYALADGSRSQQTDTGTRPDVWFQFLAVFAGAIVVGLAVLPSMVGRAYAFRSATTFAVYVVAIGVSYLVVGNSLKAYYIKRRDRLAFYAGGAWIILLGAALPNVTFLRSWGYAVFGGLYLAYSLATYLLLTRT